MGQDTSPRQPWWGWPSPLGRSPAPHPHPLPCHTLSAPVCAPELLRCEVNRSAYSTATLLSPRRTETKPFCGRLNPLPGSGQALEERQHSPARQRWLPKPPRLFTPAALASREHCRARIHPASHLQVKPLPLVSIAVTLALLVNDNS